MVSRKLKEGNYRGVLYLDEAATIELPFNFEILYKGKRPLIVFKNADERIVAEEINIRGDSVMVKMPVFDTEFKMLFVREGFEGVWINNYRTTHNRLRFKAWHGEERRFLFESGTPDPVFEGRWEVTFSPGKEDSSKAIGAFHHIEQTDHLTGTFMTETGDYRFLEGVKAGNRLLLSAFDGSHAYLFDASLNDEGKLNGKFYSGSHFVEEWIARKNNDFSLRDPENITAVVDREKKITFQFPDSEGRVISLADKRFQNKPVIVQVMGSWCPNCMDESRYLVEVFNKYNSQGLEIVALAFEKTTDPEKSKQLVQRMKTRLRVEYPILKTSYSGKDKAGDVIGNVDKIISFPTTLFLNRDHKVVKVHTGFSGPATGEAYEKYKQKTEALIVDLLK